MSKRTIDEAIRHVDEDEDQVQLAAWLIELKRLKYLAPITGPVTMLLAHINDRAERPEVQVALKRLRSIMGDFDSPHEESYGDGNVPTFADEMEPGFFVIGTKEEAQGAVKACITDYSDGMLIGEDLPIGDAEFLAERIVECLMGGPMGGSADLPEFPKCDRCGQQVMGFMPEDGWSSIDGQCGCSEWVIEKTIAGGLQPATRRVEETETDDG